MNIESKSYERPFTGINDKITDAKVEVQPFPHYKIDQLISAEEALKIGAEISDYLLPRWDVAHASSIGRRNIMFDTEDYHAFLSSSVFARPIVQHLADILPHLVYTKYKNYFDTASIREDELFCRVDLSAAQAGYVRGPHLDRERNFGINFLYLNGPDQYGGSGGDLLLMEPSPHGSKVQVGDKFPDEHDLQIAQTVTPHAGLFTGFLRTNNSWHTVVPMAQNTGPRLFIFFAVNADRDLWPNNKVVAEARREAFLNS